MSLSGIDLSPESGFSPHDVCKDGKTKAYIHLTTFTGGRAHSLDSWRTVTRHQSWTLNYKGIVRGRFWYSFLIFRGCEICKNLKNGGYTLIVKDWE